jgi:hypothetical protein
VGLSREVHLVLLQQAEFGTGLMLTWRMPAESILQKVFDYDRKRNYSVKTGIVETSKYIA